MTHNNTDSLSKYISFFFVCVWVYARRRGWQPEPGEFIMIGLAVISGRDC